MNKPNKEQLRWFWEQCGFKARLAWSDSADIVPRHQFTIWDYPDGSAGTQNLSVNPPIDLNSLFKYAVPKLSESFLGYWLHSRKGRHVALVARHTGGAEGRAEHEDPALALFWAIYKALEEKG